MSPSIMNQSILLTCPDCLRIFIPAAANEIGDDWDGGKSGSPMAGTSSGECPVCGGLSMVLESAAELHRLDGFVALAEKAETIRDEGGCFITAKFTANNRIELAAWKKNARAARARKQQPEDVVKEAVLAQSVVAMDRYLKVRRAGIHHS